MSTNLETKEHDFALKVIRALDESTLNLPDAAIDHLAAARCTAIARKKPEKVAVAMTAPSLTPAFAGAGSSFTTGDSGGDAAKGLFARLGGLNLIWPLAALVIGLAGIAYWEDQQRKAELADIDAAMLSDSLPLDAYLDHGFNAYLSRDQRDH